MKTNKNHRPPNTTKKKAIVVSLLGVLLLVVVWQNLGASTASSPSSPVAVTPTVENSTTPLSGAAALSVLLQRLPPIELQQLRAHNPFRLIVRSAAGGAQKFDDRVANITAPDTLTDDSSLPVAQSADPPVIQVNAILHGGKRPAVLIGPRLCHEHDCIEGGWKILAIHPDRVVFERIPEQ